MDPRIIKIVVLGPESTGKSTLCQQLAAHYHTGWCPEFAREYLDRHGKDYSYDDLLHIARGQLSLEDEWSKKLSSLPREKDGPRFLFIDTDMYVMKVWCEFVFGNCHRFILDRIVERKYDGYLLCNTDLPWESDRLREYPEEATRQKLYTIYRDLMINQSVPWAEISGQRGQRLELAIAAVEQWKLAFQDY